MAFETVTFTLKVSVPNRMSAGRLKAEEVRESILEVLERELDLWDFTLTQVPDVRT